MALGHQLGAEKFARVWRAVNPNSESDHNCRICLIAESPVDEEFRRLSIEGRSDMFHRTLHLLTALALLVILLVLVGLVWLKRQASGLSGAKVLPPERPPFWPAMRPQAAG